MKTRTAMMVVIVMMAIQFTMAEEPAKKFATVEQKIAFAKKNLLAALHSTNKGVIAASMRLSAQIKMRYSAEDVSELVEVMDELWQKHPEAKCDTKRTLQNPSVKTLIGTQITPYWQPQVMTLSFISHRIKCGINC